MCRLGYLLVFTGLLCFSCVVYGSENVTVADVDTLVNLTGNNELWSILLKDCQKPTLSCVQNNIFKYLKQTLDETEDLQFTSFLKFTKNNLNYGKIEKSFEIDKNDTSDENYLYEGEFPIESMSRSLQENTAKFFMTHDLEVALPDSIFPNSVLKIEPRGLENNGALVNLEVVSSDLEAARELTDGQRTFKKIRKFITEKVIYAILAVLLIVKLLAVKFLFLLPLIVGVATAKKLLLKILLFVFPFLHHVFKFCAYYPIQAKYHHHKHLISHIHQIDPHHHHHGHHEGIEVSGPHGYEPPPFEHHGHHDEHFTEFGDDVSVLPDDGTGFPHGPWIRHLTKEFIEKSAYWLVVYLPGLVKTSATNLISHRRDPTRDDNEIASYGHVHSIRRKPGQPLTSKEIERVIAKAEKEAIIKARLEKERLRIREENLRLQEQLNQAVKLQEKLKQQAVYINQKLPPTKITSSVPYGRPPGIANPPPLRGSPFDLTSTLSDGPGIELPAGYIPQHTVPQRPQNPHPLQPHQFDNTFHQSVPQDHFEQQYQTSLQNQLDQQYQPSQVNSQHQINIGLNPGPVYKPQTNHLTVTGVNRKEVASSAEIDIQKSVDYSGSFESSKEVQPVGKEFVKHTNGKHIETFEKPKPDKAITISKPELEKAIYQAASITYDKFYSPILQRIDKILQELGFNEEPCRERLICSMYKNPNKFTPHSNLLSVELSRKRKATTDLKYNRLLTGGGPEPQQDPDPVMEAVDVAAPHADITIVCEYDSTAEFEDSLKQPSFSDETLKGENKKNINLTPLLSPLSQDPEHTKWTSSSKKLFVSTPKNGKKVVSFRMRPMQGCKRWKWPQNSRKNSIKLEWRLS